MVQVLDSKKILSRDLGLHRTENTIFNFMSAMQWQDILTNERKALLQPGQSEERTDREFGHIVQEKQLSYCKSEMSRIFSRTIVTFHNPVTEVRVREY